jgi:hypothetical protein
MSDRTLETSLTEIMRLATQLKAEAILTIRPTGVTLKIQDCCTRGKLAPISREKDMPLFIGYVEALRVRLASLAERPASEFLARCSPEQLAEVRRLCYRLKCIKRDVLTPGWAAEYEPHLGPSQSSAQTAAEAALV